MAALRIGTCSWKYDSWRGLVYSAADKNNYLREYAQVYDTVEIDQWFWSLFGNDNVVLPRPEVVQDYAASVGDNFRFSIKVPNSITLTHFYNKGKGNALQPNPHFLSTAIFDRFIHSLQPLHSKIGVLICQFEYLNRQKMASPALFLDSLRNFFQNVTAPFPIAIETRNPNYLNQQYFEFLNENGLYHCFVEGYYMPPVFEVFRKFGDYLRDLTVIRLMGPDRQGIEAKSQKRWDRILEPQDAALEALAQMIDELMHKNLRIFINVNNHFEGSAPLTIRRIRALLENRR